MVRPLMSSGEEQRVGTGDDGALGWNQDEVGGRGRWVRTDGTDSKRPLRKDGESGVGQRRSREIKEEGAVVG